MIYYRSNNNKMLPTNMLESLVNHNNSVTAVMMEATADIKYQLRKFTFGRIVYTTKTRNQFPTFMLAFLFVYLN